MDTNSFWSPTFPLFPCKNEFNNFATAFQRKRMSKQVDFVIFRIENM